MEFKNLVDMSKNEFKTFLNSFDTVLCDCDGVVWHFRTPIQGVKESLKKLRQHGKQINFVSNNNTVPVSHLNEGLNKCGFETKVDEIVNPILVMIDYLKKINYSKKLFIMGTNVMKQEFRDAGFDVLDTGMEDFEEHFISFSNELYDDESVGAVICGIDPKLNYLKLQKAVVYLKRSDVLFMVGGNDKRMPVGLSVPLIGPWYFQKAVEETSERVPMGFGKPSKHCNEFLVKKFGIQDPSRTLFIGDSLEQDMAFATDYGYQKLLVLTGATNFEQAKRNNSQKTSPNYCIQSLGDLHSIITQKLGDD